MTDSYLIRKVENERWKEAQEFELKFAKDTIEADDDWNRWWSEKFDDYSLLSGKSYRNVLEVGCGPHTNVRYILPLIDVEKIWLEDPLIQYYITYSLNNLDSFGKYLRMKFFRNKISYSLNLFSNLAYKVDSSSSKLEDLPYKDNQMDLIICINVLDHVNDYDKCMQELNRVLNNNGILVLGQDLSNMEDRLQCPESYTDIGHPIKIDHLLIGNTFDSRYQRLFEKILSRDEGRNPKAHYGTYLGILQKVPVINYDNR